MRHRVAGRQLKRDADHRRSLRRNLITDLFRHGKIRTTEAKAKAIRGQAEKLISLSKRGDLHARRQALRVVRDPQVVEELFNTIGPRYGERPGGYTRLVRLGPRQGDAAPIVQLELIE